MKFPEAPKPEEKKVVEYLYIDADEDHVSLQYKEQKGDLKKGENSLYPIRKCISNANIIEISYSVRDTAFLDDNRKNVGEQL